jgi:hypothetical protein
MKTFLLILSLITASVIAKVNYLTKETNSNETNKVPKEPTSPTETPDAH